uniref:Uncharacterized protein n=1 Tax=Nymphaea colorata TaxID=210225 RepID=A0A5K1BB19_9MAGN
MFYTTQDVLDNIA